MLAVMIPMLRRYLVLLLLAAAPMLPGRLLADIKAPTGAAAGPAMKDIEFRAVRGQTVKVALRGVTGGNKAIKFEIVEQPKQGTLGAIKELHNDQAEVEYTANPKGEGDDEFIYTGQLPGTSAVRARVRVSITNVAPRIEVHPIIDAGRMVVGSSLVKDFTLLNKGNAPWTAKVPAPKNWRWQNPPGGNFQVAGGGSIRCEVVCEGAAVGVTEETVVFDGEVKARFTSRVVPPFVVDLKEVTLKWRPKDNNRQGTVTLENMGSEPVKVSVEGPPWIQLPATLDLVPDLKLPLVFKVEGQLGETLKGVVKLTVGKFVQEVNAIAVPGPGVLVMTSAFTNGDAFNFGMLSAESLKTAKHTVTVKNAGGAEAVIELSPLKIFRFETPPPAEVKLAAGVEFSVTVLPPQDIAGWPSEELVFNAPGSRLELLLVAGLEAKDIPETAGSEAIRQLIQAKMSGPMGLKSRKEVETDGALGTRGVVLETGKEDPKIPKVDLVDIVKDEGESITIAWKVPPGGDWNFEVLYPSIERPKPRRLNKIWVPCGDDVKVTVSGGVATAVVGNLVSGAPVTLCIRTLAPDGRVSYLGKPITLQFRFVKEPFNWKPWLMGAVVVAFLGYKGMKYWKKPISATS